MATFTKNFSSGWAQLVLEVSESGTSAATNAGKISWSLKVKMLVASPSWSNGGASISVTIGGTKRYSGTSFDVRGVSKGSSKTIASGSFTQTHSANGSLSLSCSASFSSGVQLGSASVSGTFTGTTIPRATTPSVSPSTASLGSAVTISTPRASSSFTHKLYYKIGSGSWVLIASGVGTSYSWTVPKTIANSFTGGSTGKITIAADTYNGSSMIGSKQVGLDITIPTTSEFQPSVSALSVSEAVSKVTSAFGSRYVQGLSRLNISASASGAYNSTIKSYSTPVDGVTYNSASFTSNVINSSGTLSITTTVKDSRNRSASKTVSISVLPYSPPTITSLTYLQCNADGTANPQGTYTKVTIGGKVASVDGQNSRSLTLKWKKSTAAAYQSKTLTTSDWTFTVSTIINNTVVDETYEFVAELADKINTAEKEGLIVTSNYFVAENGVTRRSRRFSVFIGCLRDDRLGNNGNIYIVHEVEENLHFLLALAAGFVRGIDDDFLDILVHDGLCQLLHIHIFLCQGDKGIQTVVHFFPLFHPFFDNFNFEL